jgi:hypothetical protein
MRKKKIDFSEAFLAITERLLIYLPPGEQEIFSDAVTVVRAKKENAIIGHITGTPRKD